MAWRTGVLRSWLPAMILACLTLGIGLFLLSDYGQSWDEATNYIYGEKALNYYFNNGFLRDPGEQYFHGTFYFMVWAQASKVMQNLQAAWGEVEGRHAINFLTFILGSLGVYYIAEIPLGKRYAAIALILFLTQPILFGHAFVNQKDIPFMSFFILSIASGIAIGNAWMLREIENSPAPPNSGQSIVLALRRLADHTRTVDPVRRWAWVTAILFLLIFTLDLFCSLLTLPFLKGLVEAAYTGTAPSSLVKLFRILAQDYVKSPLSAYFQKIEIAFFWFRLPLAVLSISGVLHLVVQMAPENDRRKWKTRFKNAGVLLVGASLLGMTIAIRVFGLFAGMLVVCYLYFSLKRRSFLPIIIYLSIAFLVTYLVWPTLWGNPIGRVWDRLLEGSNFAIHWILFEGVHVPSNALPWYYLPKLMSIQFTEPVLILAPLGLFFVIFGVLHKERSFAKIKLLLSAWFLIPFFSQIILAVPIYGNFRQLLFITPPLFIFSAFSLTKLFAHLRNGILQTLIVLFLIIPSIQGIVEFHPYEYAYYNYLQGGLQGADGIFELDYWCTSYRYAMEYVNKHAPQGATIGAWGPYDAANAFARNDLILYPDSSEARFFVLGCDNALAEGFHPELNTVFRVEKASVTLGIVKAPNEP